MSDPTVGVIGLLLMLVLLALRVPIAVALGLVSFFGIWVLRGLSAAMATLASAPFSFAASWSLSAVPMFLLLGAIAFHSGMTRSLFSAARLWLSWMPGGLAVATNVASAIFSAASGSSVATTAAMGRLAVPDMLRYGYDRGMATASVAAAGTLGALIPPSILMVIYGWYTSQPVGMLLIAGIIPGILTAISYIATIVIRCKINPSLAPRVEEEVTWQMRRQALLEVWPMPVIIFGVIAGIYSGFATPTEAGALGAALAILLGFVRRELNWTRLKAGVSETLKTTAVVIFIAIGAVLVTRFLAISGLPAAILDLVLDGNTSPLHLVLILCVVYLLLGMFLEPIGILLLTLPLFLPALRALDMDLIWIGVICVKLVEMGCITPPVGLNVFVVKGVVGDRVPLEVIFKGILWFLVADFVILGLIVAFPAISTWLPALSQG